MSAMDHAAQAIHDHVIPARVSTPIQYLGIQWMRVCSVRGSTSRRKMDDRATTAVSKRTRQPRDLLFISCLTAAKKREGMASQALEKQLTCKWALVRSVNMDEFLEREGAPWIGRQFAKRAKESVMIELRDGLFKTNVRVFGRHPFGFCASTDGREFSYTDMNGTAMRSTLEQVGDTLVENMTRNRDGSITRKVISVGEEGLLEMKWTRVADGVSMTRIFKKVADKPRWLLEDADPMMGGLSIKSKL